MLRVNCTPKVLLIAFHIFLVKVSSSLRTAVALGFSREIDLGGGGEGAGGGKEGGERLGLWWVCPNMVWKWVFAVSPERNFRDTHVGEF